MNCADVRLRDILEPAGATSELALGDRRLVWSDTGGDGPVLVLVHGWCCHRGFWGPAVRRFSDCRAISVDLAGHGDSLPASTALRLAAMGDDLALVLDHLALEDVILVGHSLGGAVALEAATSPRVTGVIGVDTFTDARMYRTRSDVEIRQRSFDLAADFASAVRSLVAMIILHDPDGGLADKIGDVMAAHPPQQAVGLMADLLAWDIDPALERFGRGVVTLNAVALTPLLELLRPDPRLTVVNLEQVGHFPMLEAPEAFAAALQAAVNRMRSGRAV